MLNIGDTIWLSGGYDMEPKWLHGGDGYSATIKGFIESNYGMFAIAQLSKQIESKGLDSDIILMSLRYKDAVWADEERVHIYLCKEIPTEPLSNAWVSLNAVHVESHATYNKIRA